MRVYGHNIVLSLFHPSLEEIQYCFQWDIYWYLTLFKNLGKQGPPCLSPHPPHKPAGRRASAGWLAHWLAAAPLHRQQAMSNASTPWFLSVTHSLPH
jgi:hypothetical protein